MAKSTAPTADQKARARRISATLRKTYEHRSGLDFSSPYQLLIATILSAQSTDVNVNKVTPVLFGRFPDPAALAAAPVAEVEEIVHSTGFFKQKAKAIIACAAIIVKDHGGTMPTDMEQLVKLPGVGRKTAHVVRGNALGLPALTVDTHFKRVTGRLGLTTNEDPEKIEYDIAALLPESEWTHFSNAIIWHGRRICDARKPRCAECPVLKDCPTGRSLLDAPAPKPAKRGRAKG